MFDAPTFLTGSRGCAVVAVLAAIMTDFGCKTPQQSPTDTTGQSTTATSPATRASVAGPTYTHIVKADTALLRRGASDTDVIYDTILAGARVRATGRADPYLQVVTDDGRDGLVLRERLTLIPVPLVQKTVPVKDGPNPPSMALTSGEYASFLPADLVKSQCPTQLEIDRAIDRARRRLLDHHPGLTWGKPWTLAETSLVVTALAYAGERMDNPQVADAIGLLDRSAPTDTFTSAMRAEIWSIFDSPSHKSAPGRDWLLKSAYAHDPASVGLFGMDLVDLEKGTVPTYMGLMGLDALERTGVEIPEIIWRSASDALRNQQLSNGGWALGPFGDEQSTPHLSALASGYLSLQLSADRSPRYGYLQCHGNASDPAIDRAVMRLAAFLKEPGSAADFCENCYWIERVGDTSGRKYLGGKDWFSSYAKAMVQTQRSDGSWGDDRETAFCLLFLARGIAPILMSKLQYPTGDNKCAWNERPRDIAHFVDRLTHNLDLRQGNWQTVSIDAPVEDWLEAPLLYVSGNAKLNFTGEQRDKLRDYVNRGGLIVGNADCGNGDFVKSFKSLGVKLFPKYEFRELSPGHPIFTSELYPAAKWHPRPKIMGLSNDVRELMILIPEADLSRAWQGRSEKLREDLYQLGADIYLYAAGKGLPPTKAERRGK